MERSWTVRGHMQANISITGPSLVEAIERNWDSIIQLASPQIGNAAGHQLRRVWATYDIAAWGNGAIVLYIEHIGQKLAHGGGDQRINRSNVLIAGIPQDLLQDPYYFDLHTPFRTPYIVVKRGNDVIERIPLPGWDEDELPAGASEIAEICVDYGYEGVMPDDFEFLPQDSGARVPARAVVDLLDIEDEYHASDIGRDGLLPHER